MTTPFQTATQTTTNLPSATINSTIAAIAPVHSFVPPSTPPIELKDASIEMLDPERKANYFSRLANETAGGHHWTTTQFTAVPPHPLLDGFVSDGQNWGKCRTVWMLRCKTCGIRWNGKSASSVLPCIVPVGVAEPVVRTIATPITMVFGSDPPEWIRQAIQTDASSAALPYPSVGALMPSLIDSTITNATTSTSTATATTNATTSTTTSAATATASTNATVSTAIAP